MFAKFVKYSLNQTIFFLPFFLISKKNQTIMMKTPLKQNVQIFSRI